MFDVIWTDHDRELQGEHRAKKDAAAQESSKKQERSSLSTKRSSVSSESSPFSSFFRGHGLKRINTSDARSADSSRLASPSPLATSFDGRSPRSSGAGPRLAGAPPSGKCSGEQGRGNGSVEGERSVDLSRHGSIFSKYAESDNVTSNSTGDTSLLEHTRSQGKSAAPGLDTQPVYENATWPRSSKKLVRPTAASLSASRILGPLTPARPRRPSVRPVNLDDWQTPDLWSAPFESLSPGLEPTIDILTNMLAECTAGPDQTLDVEGWRKEIDAKSRMTLDDIVPALKNIWSVSQDTKLGNSNETSVEELRWMLWALNHLDPNPERYNSPSRSKEPETEQNSKLLILYDTQDIANYIAATTSFPNFHHVSTQQAPSTSVASNEITTFEVDSLQSTDLPNITNYGAIMALTLPSLLPAVDIPPLLTAVNHALIPGGSLHLLLIDPVPRPGTLGRHMRAWLRTNLLPNIERSFRCANPTSLFPEWLAAASLRGKGSTITTTKFFANPAMVHLEAFSDMQNSTNHDHETRVKKAEIRSLTGRTLWKTIWGPFVSKGARMWWDEPICAEECIELGTIWEYHFIEGVKDAEAI